MLRLSTFLLSVLFATQAAGMEIIWSVEHPFRYFKQPSDLLIHQRAFEELQGEEAGPEKAKYGPISHIERKLNNPKWWDGNPLLDEIKQLRQGEGRSEELDLRLGWGSFLTDSAPDARGAINQTCWDDVRQRHSRCDESELHGTTGNDPFFNQTGSFGRTYQIRQGRYIYPKFHRVIIGLKDTLPAGTLCQWAASDAIFLNPDDELGPELDAIEVDCGTKLHARIAYRRHLLDPDARKVRVDVTGDGQSAGDIIEVRDILIFALGDSYSSGEGNPEIPAKLHPTRAIGPAEPKDADVGSLEPQQFLALPRRSPADGTSAAKWTDRRCHRSVYSYQTRVALQLAIAPDADGNRHHAVTYFHFTCSGAEVTEDVFYAWEGRECIADAIRKGTRNGPVHPYYSPQISKASRALCQYSGVPNEETRFLTEVIGGGDSNLLGSDDHYLPHRSYLAEDVADPDCSFGRRGAIARNPQLTYCRRDARARPIDLVLSSAGGNDIGFSKIVAKAIINQEDELLQTIGSLPGAGQILEKTLFVDKTEADIRLARLPQRLKLYDGALKTFLGVTARGGKKPVITMTYPNLIYAKDTSGADRFCPGDNTVSDVSRFLSLNAAFLPDVEQIVERPCDGNGENCGLVDAIRTSGETHGWTVVDTHRDLFKEHGVCVTDPARSPDESGRGRAEVPGIPYKLVDLSKPNTESQYAAPWARFHPVDDHYPYESRLTGFRTPNQDYLNIQYFKESMPDRWEEVKKESAIFLAQRILGGSFHPTAEAHAHIADHVYCKAREQLFGETCDTDKVIRYAHPWGATNGETAVVDSE